MIRVLLDEGVPNPLARWLKAESVDASPFPNAWKTLDDKALLRNAVVDGFDVLLTNDRTMPYQQVLTGLAIAVLVLPSLRLVDTRSFAPRIASILPTLAKGAFTLLDQDGQTVSFDPSVRKT